MNKRRLLFIATNVMPAGVTHVVEAAQLTRNTSPPDSTIDIINDPSR